MTDQMQSSLLDRLQADELSGDCDSTCRFGGAGLAVRLLPGHPSRRMEAGTGLLRDDRREEINWQHLGELHPRLLACLPIRPLPPDRSSETDQAALPEAQRHANPGAEMHLPPQLQAQAAAAQIL